MHLIIVNERYEAEDVRKKRPTELKRQAKILFVCQMI